jgi:hypothetical protein
MECVSGYTVFRLTIRDIPAEKVRCVLLAIWAAGIDTTATGSAVTSYYCDCRCCLWPSLDVAEAEIEAAAGTPVAVDWEYLPT